jgi:hypothetical protein
VKSLVAYQPCLTCGDYLPQDPAPVSFCDTACGHEYVRCVNCHQPFIKTEAGSAYCSDACKVRYIYKKIGINPYVYIHSKTQEERS